MLNDPQLPARSIAERQTDIDASHSCRATSVVRSVDPAGHIASQWIVTERLFDAVSEQPLCAVTVQGPGASRLPSETLTWLVE